MIIIVHSLVDAGGIKKYLGFPDYSYYFVLRSFLPVLRRFGVVVTVTDPGREVDAIYRNARDHGQECVFFSFTPPQHTTLDLECPTIVVFAWEFDTIPSEMWWNEPRNDWRMVLAKVGRAITHSTFAVSAVRAAMGADFPIVSIPSPVWDEFKQLRREPADAPDQNRVELNVPAIDTSVANLKPYSLLNRKDHSARPANLTGPESVPPDELTGPENIKVSGVIYTAVFNPADGRKNWFDMISSFCHALRDAVDATLILKLTLNDTVDACIWMLDALYRLSPFQCRVVIIRGYVDDSEFKGLASGTTYAVNTSTGEGQCLPLMEFMSCGKPAISPRHTSMIDYVSHENAFIVQTSLEPAYWPHDPRAAFRTLRHRIDVASLMAQYAESYRVAKHDAARYARMSEHAFEATRRHCSQSLAFERLNGFLHSTGTL